MKKYSTVEDIETIAENHFLHVVEVTQGMNGYPRGLYKALTYFLSYEDAEACAKAVGGQVVCLHKKNGWQLWENQGWQSEAFDLLDFFANKDNYEVISYGQFDNEVEFIFNRGIKDVINDMNDIDEILAYVKKEKEIWEEVCSLDEGEFVRISEGSIDIMSRHPANFCYDGSSYSYGVVMCEDW